MTLKRPLLIAVVALAALLPLTPGCSSSESNARQPSTATAEARAKESGVERPKIVAFGDSLTAGYGIEKSRSYPAQLQRLLDERGYNYEVVNAGVSGETTAGGLRRIDRFLDDDVVVVVVALGGNDGLRGLPVADMKKNLASIVSKVQAHGAVVLLAGMEAPPQHGGGYTRQFRAAFEEVAEEYEVPVVPFLLDGVAGVGKLNQVDGIHPNAEGAKKVAENVLQGLEPLLAQ
jgi:acyl-CoA thioesterase-1